MSVREVSAKEHKKTNKAFGYPIQGFVLFVLIHFTTLLFVTEGYSANIVRFRSKIQFNE
jgi:hypothetical protein